MQLQIKTGFLLAALTTPMLAACATPDFGDRLKTEGAAISSLGGQWEKGDATETRGRTLVRKGRQKIADGEEMVEDGEDLIERGQKLKRESEQAYEN